MFVNLVPIFNISQVWDAAQGNFYCQNLVPVVHACTCLTANATERQLMDDATVLFNAATEKVATETQALNDPNFMAVSQPGLADMFLADFPDAEG